MEPDTLEGAETAAVTVDATLLAQSRFVGFMTTRDRRILSVNRTILDVTGYAASELLGQPVRILYPDDASQAEAAGKALAAIARDGIYRGEQAFRRKDGSMARVEISASPLAGRPDTYAIVAVDRSARHQALAQVRLQEDILATVEDGVIVADAQRRIVFANRAAGTMLGYAPSELLDKAIDAIYANPSADFAREIDLALEATGAWRGYFQHRHKNGGTSWSELRIRVCEHPQWGTLRIGVTRDVGNRMQLQEELEQREARYRSVVEDQTEVISRILPDGTIVFVNEVYCRLFGTTAEAVIGHTWRPVAHPDDVAMIDARLGEMSPANPVVTIENRVFVAGGEVRWMQFVNRGVFGPDGTLREIQSVGRDITRLKETEAALRESEERLEMAMTGAGLVAWDWDVPADAFVLDPRVADIVGHTPRELGTLQAWLQLADPADRPWIEQAIRAALRGDSEALDLEARVRHRAGHWLTVSVRGKVLRRDANAAPLRMAGTLLDVTQRTRLNDEGLQMLRRVEALIRENVSPPSPPAPREDVLATLTRRERQVLALIAKGLTSAQIGERLGVATNTVISHRQNMMGKLGLHGTAEVIRFAAAHGLLAQ